MFYTKAPEADYLDAAIVTVLQVSHDLRVSVLLSSQEILALLSSLSLAALLRSLRSDPYHAAAG